MKQTFLFILPLLLISINTCYSRGLIDPESEGKTISVLDNFRTDYTKSLLSTTPERIINYYDDSIRLMPEFQKTISRKSNALKYHTAFLSRFKIENYIREKIEVLDLGLRVVETGIFTMKMTTKSSGDKNELKGKYVNIWKKNGNGGLTLVTEAWNYNHFVPFNEQLKFEELPSLNVALAAHVPVNNNLSFELASLNLLMKSTISQHDNKIWAQFYTDDAMFIYSYHPIYQGRKKLDEFLDKHTKELPVFKKLEIRNDKIDDLGKFVIEYASHIAMWRNGEYSGTNTGKDIRIWRREPNGSLKIFRQIAMYDL